MLRNLTVAALLVCVLVRLAPPTAHAADTAALQQDVMQTYADIVYASYADTLTTVTALHDTVDTFLEAPTAEGLTAARAAWVAANGRYSQTDAFRFYGGPIDDDDQLQRRIDAWPLDEAIIDYTTDNPDAGMISDTEAYPYLHLDALYLAHQTDDERHVTLGFHAVEFLLWGQDLSADTAGQRPHTDYTTAPHADRRAAYLRTALDLLVRDIETVTREWDPSVGGNYRARFLAAAPQESLAKVLTGIGVLAAAEMSGARIYTAYDNYDQEDEHACFSDTTHNVLTNNLVGVANVYTGRYVRLDGSVVTGAGVGALVAEAAPDLHTAILATLAEADTMVRAIHVPFDQAIIQPETRPHVLDTVWILMDLGDLFVEAGYALDVEFVHTEQMLGWY